MSSSTTARRTAAAAVSAVAGESVALARRPATAPVSDEIAASNRAYVTSLNLPPLTPAQAQLIRTLAEAANERSVRPAA